MKKIILPLFIISIAGVNLFAQKIIPIEYDGKKYEVLDMTSKGKVTWGGYMKKLPVMLPKANRMGQPIQKQL